MSAIQSSTGDRTGTVVVARDVTVRRRQRELLEKKKRELERHNERLDQFVSTVSHDLRNPLTVAKGRLELAQSDVDNEHLDIVADTHERMEALIGGQGVIGSVVSHFRIDRTQSCGRPGTQFQPTLSAVDSAG